MNWLYYLAEANLYLSVFYVAYCLFLNKETHYLLNRTYLIFSCVVSFILPVLQVGALRPAEPEAAIVSYVVPVQTAVAITAQAAAPVVAEHHFTLHEGLWYAYLLGAVILLLVLFVRLYNLFRLVRAQQPLEQDKYKLIYIPGSGSAFSFFNYLFLGTNAPKSNTIIRHELVHIRQKHSADIIFLELLKIINWFNPFIYLLQNSLKTVHEYIADEKTAAYENDAFAYSSFLVDNAYGASGSSITHSFFNYNLLKNRIIMLNRERSGNLAKLKYLVALPICAGLLCASTLAFSKTYGWVDLAPGKAFPVNTISDNDKIPTISYTHLLYAADLKGPVIVANNKIIYVPHSSVDSLELEADKILYYNKNDAGEVKTAMSKWGKKAKNGVFELIGNYKITGAKSLSGNTKSGKSQTSGQSYDPNKYPSPPAVPLNFKPAKSYINAKGYKIEEGGFTVNGKTYYVAIIGNRSGKKLPFANDVTGKKLVIYKGAGNASGEEMIFSHYGYTFPEVNVSSFSTPPPPPMPVSDKKVKRYPPPVVVSDSVFYPFYSYLEKTVRYPDEDKQNNYGGRVFASFTVNANHKVKDIAIRRSPSNSLADEVTRVLQICTFPPALKPGVMYTVPIYFALHNKDGKYIEPEKSSFIDNHKRLKTDSEEQPVGLDEVVIDKQK